MDADTVYKNYTSDYSARISGKESVLQEAGDKIMTVGAEPGKFQLWYKIPGLVQNGTPAEYYFCLPLPPYHALCVFNFSKKYLRMIMDGGNNVEAPFTPKCSEPYLGSDRVTNRDLRGSQAVIRCDYVWRKSTK